MKKKISIALGLLGILLLAAFQSSLYFNKPLTYNTRASEQVVTRPNTIVANTVADAYTASNKPAKNFGKESKLLTEKKPVNTVYLKFDLTSYKSAQLQDIILRIKSKNSSQGQTLSLVKTSDWQEKTINYNNRPKLSQTLQTFAVKNDTWNEIVISKEQIQPYIGHTLTLSIDNTSDKPVTYHSRETSSPPQLLLKVAYPSININSPVDGATVGQNFDMAYATTNWDLGLTNNKFAKILIDGEQSGSSYQSPVQFRGLAVGEHIIELTLATMDGSEIGVKDSIKINVQDTQTPSISITSPETNSYVSPGFDLHYSLSNWTNTGYDKDHVEIYINDINRGKLTLLYAPFSGLPAGDYKVTLKLVKGDGTYGGAEDTINVKVPGIDIYSPMVGYAVPPNFDVKFNTTNWAYSPTEGRIARVIVDGVEVGPLVLENYAPFNGLSPGVHIIRLELTENRKPLYGSGAYDEVMILVQ